MIVSLLWAEAARWQRRQAAFEDTSEEARDRRRQRVQQWLRRQPDRMNIPAHVGQPVSYEKLRSVLPDISDLHWHHVPERQVNLNQRVHFAQPTATRDVVHEKLKEDSGHDDYDLYGSEYGGSGDEHDPPEEPLFVKHPSGLYLLDGHHRFLKSRLMGQQSMWGHIYDHEDPTHAETGCYDCEEHKDACPHCGDW